MRNNGYPADQLDNINPQPTNHVWFETTGTALPTGTFSDEQRRPSQSLNNSAQASQVKGRLDW
jgi:hypothetical protein